MTLRSFVFWPHLAARMTAGAVIFLMAITGVLLTYEKQMVAWADRDARLVLRGDEAALPLDDLITRVASAHDGALPSAITLSSAAEAPALVVVTQTTWLVNPYDGATIGPSAPRLRRFFRVVTDWHRWLAAGDVSRPLARAVTGWSNVLFLFIIVSGAYLWLTKRWSWWRVKPVVVLDPRLLGKARDFNWHNAIGIWSTVPLFFIVIGITPVSFSWANAALFRFMGEEAPSRPPAAPREGPRRGQGSLGGLEEARQLAQRQVPGWRTISVRLPVSHGAPLSFTIDRGSGGQPQLRATLTFDRTTGQPRCDVPDHRATVQLTSVYHNLLRRWAEM